MPLNCTVNVPRLCNRPALQVLLARDPGGPWTAFPRCDEHPAELTVGLLRKVSPAAEAVVLGIAQVDVHG